MILFLCSGVKWLSWNVFLARKRLHGGVATLLGNIQFQAHLLDVQQLLIELPASLGDALLKGFKLGAVAVGLVEVDQLLAFSQ